MRPNPIAGLAIALFLGLTAYAAPQTAEQAPPAPPAEEAVAAPAAEPAAAEEAPPAEATAAMACSDCHEQAATFTANPHARGQVENGTVSNGTCELCHGDGAAHMEAGGDKTLIVKPAGRAGSETCTTCHDTATDRKSTHTGVHANSASVNCLSCHSIHHSAPKAAHLLVREQGSLCTSCHAGQAASMRNKPYAHRMGRGGMQCASCHEPHGRPGKENLKVTKAGEAVCLECHVDKRGPHVFQHSAGQIGDCMSCHESHGSANPKQLKRARVDQLCLECHSQSHVTLASQPPSFHNVSNARFQNCTTCHVAIHGSNRSPQLLK
jgi:DmsE family decaheme c-type cytochrome